MGAPDFMISTNWRGGPLVVVGAFSRLGNICAVDGSRILPLDESDLSRRVYVFPGETFYPLDVISATGAYGTPRVSLLRYDSHVGRIGH